MDFSSVEPIAVTGIGMILPGVSNVSEFWASIRDGIPKVGKLTRFDGQKLGLDIHAAAEIRDFDCATHLPGLSEGYRRKYSREILVAMTAISEAFFDAGFRCREIEGPRLSIVQSSSRACQEWWEKAMMEDATGIFDDVGALFCGLPGAVSSLAAIYLGAQGLVTTLSSACVGGHHAVGLAMDQLRSRRADVVLAGGFEFPILASVASCYRSLGHGAGVLSREKHNLAHAVKPYDKNRDGFVFGEGAITLCLERESDARARGATIRGLLFNHVPFNEAGHGTSMDLTGDITARVLVKASHNADRSLRDVDFIMGHGTATKTNDFAECQAVKSMYKGTSGVQPPLISNKAIFGHTFGAAGIINLAATVLAMYEQTIPCTANLMEVSPECDIDHAAEGPRASPIDFALSLSFAFGSQTSVIAVGAA